MWVRNFPIPCCQDGGSRRSQRVSFLGLRDAVVLRHGCFSVRQYSMNNFSFSDGDSFFARLCMFKQWGHFIANYAHK